MVKKSQASPSPSSTSDSEEERRILNYKSKIDKKNSGKNQKTDQVLKNLKVKIKELEEEREELGVTLSDRDQLIERLNKQISYERKSKEELSDQFDSISAKYDDLVSKNDFFNNTFFTEIGISLVSHFCKEDDLHRIRIKSHGGSLLSLISANFPDVKVSTQFSANLKARVAIGKFNFIFYYFYFFNFYLILFKGITSNQFLRATLKEIFLKDESDWVDKSGLTILQENEDKAQAIIG